MQQWIDEVRLQIKSLVNEIQLKLKAKLRLSFIGYRDWIDKERIISFNNFKFTSNINELITFLTKIKSEGGGDFCEDVIGGLNSCKKLDWKSSTKVLFHICDDPPHNTKYHSFYDKINDEKDTLLNIIGITNKMAQELFIDKNGNFTDGRYTLIFDQKHDTMDNRLKGLEIYLSIKKESYDSYPNGHPKDVNHMQIFNYFKKQGIQYFIGKKTDNVNKMIDVFKNDCNKIEYNIETRELMHFSELFDNVIVAVSNAITIAKKGVKHGKFS